MADGSADPEAHPQEKGRVMHSYINNADGTYTVGIWVISSDASSTLWRLFDVADFVTACRAVSMLNGGGQPFWNEIKIIKEH